MHALIVVAHPDPQSRTSRVAAGLAEGLRQSGQAGEKHSAEIADLAAEGFDPRFTAADLAAFRLEAPVPADVLAEQARIERADALVLVYPVYWWSMPGQLKGWIDRVFTNGWAYDELPEGGLAKRLGHLPVHLVAIGAADLRTYARHGYYGAMRTQIDHGIFDYCGAGVATSELLVDSHLQDPQVQLEAARALGREVFEAAGCRAAAAA
ncbi:MAG: NAD(P)H-dependent oxidoreductase [Tistlia sp.]